MNQKFASLKRIVLLAFAVLFQVMFSTPLHATASGQDIPTEYTKTKYPIVLAHGLFGFDKVLFIDYFYGVRPALERSGATVYSSTVSAANSSEVRGAQLLQELRRLKAVFGHQKFNLIGHSHGSQSVRYVAKWAPELVASVTVIGGPNEGSAVADWLSHNLQDTTMLRWIVSTLVNIGVSPVSLISSGQLLPQNSWAALQSLTTQGTAKFNKSVSDGRPKTPCGNGDSVVKGIHYFSATGVPKFGFTLDPSDFALNAVRLVFDKDGDGLVGRCSARWGEVIADNYNWNHADQINQTLGIKRTRATDTLAFYRTHANRLKNLGL